MTTTLQVTGYTPDPLNPTTPHLVVPHFIGEPTPESLIRFTPWRIESGEKDGVRILLVRRDAFRSFGGLPYDRTRFLREAGVVAVLSESKNDFVPQVDVLLSQAITDETKKHLRAIVEDVLYPKKSFEEKTPALRPGNLPLADEDAEEDLWQGVKLRVVGCEPVHPDRATPRLVKPRFNTDDGAAHCLVFPAVRVKNRDVRLLAVRRHELKSLEGLPVSLTGGISPDPFDVLIFLAKDDAELSQVLASLILRARTASCTTRLREIRDAIPLKPDPAEKHLPKKDLGTPSWEKRSDSEVSTPVSAGSSSTQEPGVVFSGGENANTSSLEEDIYIYIPRREPRSEDAVSESQESSEDLEFFRKKMFEGLKIPEEYRRLGNDTRGPAPNKSYKVKAGKVRKVRPLPEGRLPMALVMIREQITEACEDLDLLLEEMFEQHIKNPKGEGLDVDLEAEAVERIAHQIDREALDELCQAEIKSARRDLQKDKAPSLEVVGLLHNKWKTSDLPALVYPVFNDAPLPEDQKGFIPIRPVPVPDKDVRFLVVPTEAFRSYNEGRARALPSKELILGSVPGLAAYLVFSKEDFERTCRDLEEESIDSDFSARLDALWIRSAKEPVTASKTPRIIGFYPARGLDEPYLTIPIYENSRVLDWANPCLYPEGTQVSDTDGLLLVVQRKVFRNLPSGDLTRGNHPKYAAFPVSSAANLRALCDDLTAHAIDAKMVADLAKLATASRRLGFQP